MTSIDQENKANAGSAFSGLFEAQATESQQASNAPAFSYLPEPRTKGWMARSTTVPVTASSSTVPATGAVNPMIIASGPCPTRSTPPAANVVSVVKKRAVETRRARGRPGGGPTSSRRVRAFLPQRDLLPSPWGRCSAAGVPVGDTGAGPGNCVPGCLARTWEASPARTWNCCEQTGQTSASAAPSEPRDSEDPEEDGKAPPGGPGGAEESANISAESVANVTAHRLPT